VTTSPRPTVGIRVHETVILADELDALLVLEVSLDDDGVGDRLVGTEAGELCGGQTYRLVERQLVERQLVEGLAGSVKS
jgi:hypothetical protein